MSWEPDYIDGSDLAAFVRTASDDPYVASLATAASRAIDDLCHRQFGKLDAPGDFTYDAVDAVQDPRTARWLLAIDDVYTAAGFALTVDGTTVDEGTAGYQLWPRNVLAKGGVYTHVSLADRPYGDVVATSPFGWAAFPAQVVAAARLQGSRWHVRRESPYGTTGQPTEGTELRLSARMDPDVRAMLRSPRLVRARRPR